MEFIGSQTVSLEDQGVPEVIEALRALGQLFAVVGR
jgi:hypothetical protein